MKEVESKEMTLIDHISDLRTCLIHCCWIIIISTGIAFYFRLEIFDFLWLPFKENIISNETTKINFTKPLGTFVFMLHLSMVTGIIMSLPLIIYEVFKFIAPGLKANEIKVFRTFSLIGSILFIMGISIAYKYIIPRVVQMMDAFRPEGAVSFITDEDFFTTILKIIFGIGLVFQFPLIQYFSVKIGLITTETLSKNRKIILVVILIISAFVTPPDPMSMVIIALPFYSLYEITLFLCKKLIKE